MAKLTNEYIQQRIAGNHKVKEAFIDDNGDAVIVAADGYGWNCGEMSPAAVDIIPAGKGAKHFNLSLDQIAATGIIAPVVVQEAPAALTVQELVIEEPAEIEGEEHDHDAND